LVHLLQAEGSNYTSKDLRGHVERPKVAEEKAFSLLCRAVRDVFALAYPLYRLAKAIQD
jgi:hypothetical protein